MSTPDAGPPTEQAPVDAVWGPAPGLKLAGLVGLAVAALLTTSWWVLGALLGIPVLWWFAHGKSPWRLLRLLRRAAFLLSMLLISFVIVPPPTDTEIIVHLVGRTLDLSGLVPGGRMCLRILTIIVGSIAIRETGRPQEFLVGLRQLRLPLPVAQTVAATLALLGDGPGRRRGGRKRKGGGDGSGEESAGLRDFLRTGKDRLAGKLASSFEETIAKSQAEIGEKDATGASGAVSDAAVVTTLVVMAMAVKFVKILPGIPFASGHKLVVIIPLYFAAARLTRTRLGAIWFGVTLGLVAFMFGEGRFGLLEIAKYLAAGVVADLAWPLLRRRPNVVLFGTSGLLMGVAWLGATLVVGWIARAPALFFAIVLGTAVPQFIFATIGGTLSWPLSRVLDRARQDAGATPESTERHPAGVGPAMTSGDRAQQPKGAMDDG